MRVLVTGSSGFIGRHFCRFLMAQGIEVFTLGSSPGNAPAANHTSCRSPLDLQVMSAAVRMAKPDAVAHLAGAGAAESPAQFYLANALYAATLFSALDEAGFKSAPVLLVGSAAEYGFVEAQGMPIEETRPEAPVTHYGLSKFTQTKLGLLRWREGKPVVIARPFNIAGPGIRNHLAIGHFAEQILAVKRSGAPGKISVGNLSTSRDYLWVSDAVAIMWALLTNPQSYGETVNVCSGKPLAINDILKALIHASGADVSVEVDPARVRKDDMEINFGSPRKMMRLARREATADVLSCLPLVFER